MFKIELTDFFLNQATDVIRVNVSTRSHVTRKRAAAFVQPKASLASIVSVVMRQIIILEKTQPVTITLASISGWSSFRIGLFMDNFVVSKKLTKIFILAKQLLLQSFSVFGR